MFYLFIFIIILIIILWVLLLKLRKDNIEIIIEEELVNNLKNINNVANEANLDSNIPNALNSCQVPSLNTEQCYKSRYFECPIVNGTYLQCTNNYIPKPEKYNADCGNRTFEMVPYPWKISENCYYDKIKFNRNKTYDKVKFV
jgi:hypothetical protein